ncbi:MAG TPA: hypothetical protein VLR49_01035 [Ferruginibacter sp.]|nr:hypothetical protein [Ferruginibacter sp.]
MNKFTNSFKSLFRITRININSFQPQVLFYYPQHFNQGADGTNDFLKPLIDSCKKNNISFLVLEEPANNNAPRNKNAIPFDFVFYCIILLRKLLPLNNYPHFDAREWKIARVLKPIFFRKIKPEVVITMSNSLLGFFRGLWKDTPIYDYQHGIIYSWHHGYMSDNKATSHIVNNNCKLLLYGEGFRKLMNKQNDHYYNKNCEVIGTTVEYKELHKKFNGDILLCLQITTASETFPLQGQLMQQLALLFQSNQSFYKENNICFYIKHHPRFDGTYNIESILSFPFVKVINKPLPQCLEMCSVHMTYGSTTTFDAAVAGIPTLFFGKAEDNILFEKEFQYPGFRESLEIQDRIEDFVKAPASYKDASLSVLSWVKNYYSPYNEIEFLKLVETKV